MIEIAKSARINGQSDLTSVTTSRPTLDRSWRKARSETIMFLFLNKSKRLRGGDKEKVFGMIVRTPSTTTRVSLGPIR
jgi:hypothetical protein